MVFGASLTCSRMWITRGVWRGRTMGCGNLMAVVQWVPLALWRGCQMGSAAPVALDVWGTDVQWRWDDGFRGFCGYSAACLEYGSPMANAMWFAGSLWRQRYSRGFRS